MFLVLGGPPMDHTAAARVLQVYQEYDPCNTDEECRPWKIFVITFPIVALCAFIFLLVPKGVYSRACVTVYSRACVTVANHRKKLEVIQRRSEFPVKLRNAIDEWKEESPGTFLSNIESRLLELLFENYNVDRLDATKGLNCDRDTEAEIEAIIRVFPNVLMEERRVVLMEERRVVLMEERHVGLYPVHAQLNNMRGQYNVKAVPFIPLLARLGIELGQFEPKERGGLLIPKFWRENTVLSALAIHDNYDMENNEAHHCLVDESFLVVMKKLRGYGLFRKEDILEYNLMSNLCSSPIFPAQRFRYVTDWYPNTLAMTLQGSNMLPMQMVARNGNIHRFRIVLEAGMRYFPTKIGFLFHKFYRTGTTCTTAYHEACKRYGNEEVENIFNTCRSTLDNTTTTTTRQANKNSTIDSLIFAATGDIVCLDAVYFVLKREPNVLLSFEKKVKRNDREGEEEEEEKEKKMKMRDTIAVGPAVGLL